MEENNWYLYRHLKPCGEVFYIGVGKSKGCKRAYSRNNRNKWWENKIKKYPNYEVQILKTGLTKEDAIELEKILISWYKRRDCCGGTLVNMTDGGEGTINIIVSEEQKKKKSEAFKGELNPFYGKKHSEEVIQILRNNQLGKKHSKETLYKMKEAREKYLSSDNVYIPSKNGELNPKAKLVLCYETGVFYLTAKEASVAYNIKYSTLKSYLQGRRINKTTLMYC